MKVLASDFDNTLFFLEDKETTEKNICAIKEFISLGNIFCIVTGRTYMEIKEDLLKLDIPYTYLVCGDGALIFDSTDYCLKRVGLSKELLDKAMNFLKENNYQPYLEDGYNITTNPNDCIKISAEYTDKNRALKIIEKINQDLDVYAYASRKHINVNNKTNEKKQAILRLAEIVNLSPNDFNVIGDDINDYEMLEAFNGALITKHNPILDKLKLPEYDSLYQYIESLLNE